MAPLAGRLSVLVDTNVVLDLVLAREPWASEARPIWDARDSGRLIAYLSASALTDIYYICRKQVGVDRAKAAVEVCMQRFEILPVDRGLLEAALKLSGPDFEDDVIIACAQAVGAALIVTRDATGFRSSPVPAVEPSALAIRLSNP